MKQLSLTLLFIFLALAPRAHAQPHLTKQQEKNLVAFAHLYGYVQYFHPSDEAQQVFWPMFSIKGSKQMLAVKNDQQLIQALNGLFQPLAPTMQLFLTSQRRKLAPAAPPAAATQVVSWQHQGLRTGRGQQQQFFRSVRLNRPAKDKHTSNFLKDIDISHFAGQPYEVALTMSTQAGSRDFTVALAHAQVLGQTYNAGATQHLAHWKLTPQPQTHTFRGTFAAAARTLDGTLTFPAAAINGAIKVNIATEVFVWAAGQKVRLPLSSTKGDGATKQEVELTISSDDLMAEPLYPEQLHLGDHINQEIAPGISCMLPLALPADAAHTYPLGDSLRRQQLHVQLADWGKYPAEWSQYERPDQLTLPEVRVSNIVNAWNCLRHGYAYWTSASATPNALLHRALRQAYQDDTYVGFDRTLRRLMAPLNDGHGFVTTPTPPDQDVALLLGKAENQVVVTRVLTADLAAQVQPGDVVLRIDGVPARRLLRERASLVSGSPQNKESRALLQLLSGPAAQPLNLTLRRKNRSWRLSLPRAASAALRPADNALTAQRANGWLASGVYYYNLCAAGQPFRLSDYDTLARAKAIVFDVRGYPSAGNAKLVDSQLLEMLLKAPAEATLFYDLNMLRPDQEGLRLAPNVRRYAPGPHHLAGNMFFLTDATTQSAPETFLALIRAFKLGTLVGWPTSGANGNTNSYPLQGGFSISYSGLYVLNADGSRHHAIGIRPDVLVEATLESVRKGQDLTLETALRLAKDGK